MSVMFSTPGDLNNILDANGFSEERVRERILYMDKMSEAECLTTLGISQRSDIVQMFVGSLREGTGMLFYSDTDIQRVYKSVLCIENVEQIYDPSKTVLCMESDATPAGHFHLRLIHPRQLRETSKDIRFAFVEKSKKQYLSSDIFMQRNDDIFANSNSWINRFTCFRERRGPSFKNKSGQTNPIFKRVYINNSRDYVRVLPCNCPIIINTWKERARHYQWPSKFDIETVSSMPACLVPVGQRGSKLKHLQWRLCFTLAEIHLIKSMNNTHTKVYFLLKMIAKYFLKSLCKHITSYVIKNVIMWQAEERSTEEYLPQHIIARTIDALQFLSVCLCNKELQTYLIPRRNLLAKIEEPDIGCLRNAIDYIQRNLKRVVHALLASSLLNLSYISDLESIKIKKENQFSCGQLAKHTVSAFYHKKHTVLFRIRVNLVLRCLIRPDIPVVPGQLSIEEKKSIGCYYDLDADTQTARRERSKASVKPEDVNVKISDPML